jgi:tetratricopeptide (TPR) repeat protein
VSGDCYQQNEALIGLAAAYLSLRRPEEAMSTAEDALALSRQVGYRMFEGLALAARAAIHLDEGRLEHAVEDAESAVVIQRETGHRLGEARALVTLGRAQDAVGRGGVARTSWREALEIFVEVGVPEADEVRELLRVYAAPAIRREA